MSESKNFDPKSLDDLLAKVRAAPEPSRALDGQIYAVLDLRAEWAANDPEPLVWREDGHVSLGRNGAGWRSDVVTASVDAALLLLSRVLPGWSLQLHAHPGASYATLYRLGEIFHTDGRIQRNVTSPYFEGIRIQDEHVALAICEAILSSLKAST